MLIDEKFAFWLYLNVFMLTFLFFTKNIYIYHGLTVVCKECKKPRSLLVKNNLKDRAPAIPGVGLVAKQQHARLEMRSKMTLTMVEND